MRPAAPVSPAGFTLIEMMITLAIAAILILLAAPAMTTLIQTQQVRTAAADLHSALNFARSEALKRAASVEVVPVSGDWKNGWVVQLADGTRLRAWPALNAQLASMPGSGESGRIAYRSDGHAGAAAPALVVRSTANPQVAARCLTVDLSGRPALTTDSDGNADNGCQPQ